MDNQRLVRLQTFRIWLILLVLSHGSTARSCDAGQSSTPDLVRSIESVLAAPPLKSGFQGIVVETLRDHTIMYERNADQVFLPASNNKLLTSSAALAVLGARFTYSTRVYRIGNLKADGTLIGDLYIRGSGDPLLTETDIETLAQQVHSAGIVRITGYLHYDDTLFDRRWLGDNWSWDDEPYAYSAQVSALNVDGNVVHLRVLPGRKVGNPATIVLLPATHSMVIRNEALTGPPGSSPTIEIDRIRGSNTIRITGSLAQHTADADVQEFAVTVENPAHYAAVLLLDSLHRTGIRIHHVEIKDAPTVPATASMVAEHISITLAELLPKLNKPSDNLIAECLLKTIGAHTNGVGTSGINGTGPAAARQFYASIGLDLSAIQQVDGSGLSRTNFVSPRNLVRLLSYATTTPDFQVFYDSLPIAGVDGTLANRMKNTRAANNCHAKTGTLANASGLSGYVTTKDGERLVFSILMNNHLAGNRACTTAQDAIVTLLANYSRRQNAEGNAVGNR